MPRIYLPVHCSTESLLSVTGEKARYLVSVLRCEKGDSLVVFDGTGKCFRTEIIKADKKEVLASVVEVIPCDTESDADIVLVQGLLKGEKMDMVVQKATELGVTEIIPAITERSQLRETRKTERWRKISEEAAKQSGRGVVPVIHEPILFNEYFRINNSCRGIIFYEAEGMKLTEAVAFLRSKQAPILLAIGPEGGFSKEEICIAEKSGMLVTSLGKRILRAETAALAAVAIIQYSVGDLG